MTARTVFHHSHLPLQKWFEAIWLIVNADKTIPARHLADLLQVNKNTAWSMTLRIREAISDSEQRKLLSHVTRLIEAASDGTPYEEILHRAPHDYKIAPTWRETA